MREAESEAIKIKMSQNNAPKPQNGFRRNKHWWNKELTNYKNEIKLQYKKHEMYNMRKCIYINFKMIMRRTHTKLMRKDFRRLIRKSQFEVKTKVYLKINQIKDYF